MVGNWNQLTKAKKEDIVEKLKAETIPGDLGKPFGDGKSAEKIVRIIDSVATDNQ